MINVNLLPEDIKTEIKQSKKNAEVLSLLGRFSLFFMVYVLILTVFYFYLSYQVKVTATELTKREQAISKYSTLEEKARRVADRLATVKNIQKNSNHWTNLIKELGTVVPDGVYLNAVRIDPAGKGRNQITGYARSKQEVAALRDSMEKSSKFRYVDIESSVSSSSDKVAQESFTISFSLEKDALK